ncbi:MaoC family dehydratase N-terminal domain-containing protein [Achromobacter sp. SD115]|uniref:MaoC family dehydratase N-terminal domain-containing protein n=1 Tax=Achromobacter sp. SD115 TaxID=2782011 RepID=UPI001A97B790|nr:MaoC family dehydratase N-terminal domain-containing protein [Achromobacter sp. SD115]MBO1017116.1 MaoC family dehydratase N-terminal domain-containing protein [Achromobacter sp. SD115]
MLDRNLIGQSLGTRSILVERGRLRFFAKAIGETNPVYLDEEAARAAGHPRLPVPPTFLFCLEIDAFDSIGTARLTRLDESRVLHGEQQFSYHAMAYAGDTLTFDLTVADVYQKKGGALDFLVKDTRVTNQHGWHIADLRAIVVQRND